MSLASLLTCSPKRPCPVCRTLSPAIGDGRDRCRVSRDGVMVACGNALVYNAVDADDRHAIEAVWDYADGSAERSRRLVAGVPVMLYLRRAAKPAAGWNAAELHRRMDAEAEAARADYTAQGTASARKIWQRAQRPQGREGLPAADHPRVRAYLASRGIDVALLPGGVVPASLVYIDQCPAQSGRHDDPIGPAMVARVDAMEYVEAKGRAPGPSLVFRAVHRTFLDPAGVGKRPAIEGDEHWANPKQMRGPCKGGAIFLSRQHASALMVVAEGIETTLSAMVAMASAGDGWAGGGCRGAALLSADGVASWQIPVGIFDAGGPVKTLIIVADRNRTGTLRDTARHQGRSEFVRKMTEMGMDRPTAEHVAGLGTGERAAWTLWQRLRVERPHLAAAVVMMPGGDPKDTWDANDELHAPQGGGLDVVRRVIVEGSERAQSMLAERRGGDASVSKPDSTPDAPADGGDRRPSSPARGEVDRSGDAGGGGNTVTGEPWRLPDPEDRPILEDSPVERARRWLLQEFGSIARDGQLGLRSWGGRYWRFDGRAYEPIDDELMSSSVIRWMSGFSRVRNVGGVDKIVGVVPKRGDAETMLAALYSDAVVASDETPCWLPPQSGAAGGPAWSTRFASPAKAQSWSPQFGRAADWIVFPNGRLNMARLCDESLPLDRRVELVPHDARLFTSTCLGFPLDVEGLKAVLACVPKGDGWLPDDCPVFLDRCPKFWGWLGDACCDDPLWQRQLACMLGDTIAADRRNEKIFAMVGLPGGGKGYIQDVIMGLIGAGNIGALTNRSFTDKTFGLSHLVGKSVVLLNEGDLGGQRGGEAASDLKALRSGDLMPVRNLYGSTQSLRMRLRIWLFANLQPDLQDQSGALADSFVWLPVNRGVRNTAAEDPTIKASAGAEASGIMLFGLLGAIMLARSSRREIPLCVDAQRMRDEYLARSAPVLNFVTECLEQPAAAELDEEPTIQVLHWAHKWRCRRILGSHPLGMPNFERSLEWAIKRLGPWELRRGRGPEMHERSLVGWTVRKPVREQVRQYVIDEGLCPADRIPECLGGPDRSSPLPYMS